MKANKLIEECRAKVAAALKKSMWAKPLLLESKDFREGKARNALIGRYTASVAGEFQVWLGATYAFARHEVAQHALKDNIRCEIGNDHVGMLYDFAKQAHPHNPTWADREWMRDHLADMRTLFKDLNNIGLVGVTVLAVLESTSTLFIPVLAAMGKANGVTDFTYTNVHGEADVAHSDAFIKAMDAEQTAGYQDPDAIMQKAAMVTTDFVLRIFADANVK